MHLLDNNKRGCEPLIACSPLSIIRHSKYQSSINFLYLARLGSSMPRRLHLLASYSE